MKAGTEEGEIPANELVNIRPTVMAGLAKLVDEAKKYALAMYDPTAAGTLASLRARRSSSMVTRSPAVATTSDTA